VKSGLIHLTWQLGSSSEPASYAGYRHHGCSPSVYKHLRCSYLIVCIVAAVVCSLYVLKAFRAVRYGSILLISIISTHGSMLALQLVVKSLLYK
jgi:hypothetical protein